MDGDIKWEAQPLTSRRLFGLSPAPIQSKPNTFLPRVLFSATWAQCLVYNLHHTLSSLSHSLLELVFRTFSVWCHSQVKGEKSGILLFLPNADLKIRSTLPWLVLPTSTWFQTKSIYVYLESLNHARFSGEQFFHGSSNPYHAGNRYYLNILMTLFQRIQSAVVNKYVPLLFTILSSCINPCFESL